MRWYNILTRFFEVEGDGSGGVEVRCLRWSCWCYMLLLELHHASLEEVLHHASLVVDTGVASHFFVRLTYFSPSCFLWSLKLKSLSFSLVSSVSYFSRFSTSELSESLELELETFSLVSSVSAFYVFPLQNCQNHRITGAGIRDLLFIWFLEFFLNYFLFRA